MEVSNTVDRTKLIGLKGISNNPFQEYVPKAKQDVTGIVTGEYPSVAEVSYVEPGVDVLEDPVGIQARATMQRFLARVSGVSQVEFSGDIGRVVSPEPASTPHVATFVEPDFSTKQL